MIDLRRIDNLLSRRVFHLKAYKDVTLKDFCKLFSHNMTVVSSSGTGITVPSKWNPTTNARAVRFKSNKPRFDSKLDEKAYSSATKNYKKPYLTQQEELQAFNVFLLTKLDLY